MTVSTPVLLIHGIDDTGQVFDKMAAYLSDRAWPDIHTLDLVPNNGDRELEHLALQVQHYVDTHLTQVPTFDLVGFSMGGLVGRYYIQRLGGAQKVRKFITISSPHHGTWLAYFRQNPAAVQMRPSSPFLQDLNEAIADLQQVDLTSIWTPYDLMIVPASSSQLPIGQNITLPVMAHPLMLTDERCLETVARVLEEATVPNPEHPVP